MSAQQSKGASAQRGDNGVYPAQAQTVLLPDPSDEKRAAWRGRLLEVVAWAVVVASVAVVAYFVITMFLGRDR